MNKSGMEGDGSPRLTDAARLKAGRCYIGESGRVTTPVQWRNWGPYFVSYEIDENGLRGSIQGRWNADGSVHSKNPDSLTARNYGRLVSEASAAKPGEQREPEQEGNPGGTP